MWRSSLPDFHCESLQQIHESLGFVPSAAQESHCSSNPAVVALSKDISAFARCIYEAPNGEQLARASRTGEFNEELDALLDVHGANIWGRDVDDRSHLRKPNANSLYKNHLVWENVGNWKYIRHHVHQWTFFKVSYLERNAKKDNENSRITYTTKPQHTTMLGDTHQSRDTSDRSSGRVNDGGRQARVPRSQQSADTAMDSTTMRKRSAPALPNTRTSRKTQRVHGPPSDDYEDTNFYPTTAQTDVDDTESIFQPTLRTAAPSSTDHSTNDQLRRFELADSLVKYIYRIDISTIDQSVVLDQLEAEWMNNREYYQDSTTVLYAAFDAALAAWLELQRTVFAAQAGRPSDGGKAKAQRFLLWNKLRTQHLKWTTTTYQVREHGLVGEQVLSLLFTNMASMWGADGLDTFEEGLKGLDDEIKEIVRGGAMGGLMGQ